MIPLLKSRGLRVTSSPELAESGEIVSDGVTSNTFTALANRFDGDSLSAAQM